MFLVTGFEPFGEHESNPSQAVARRLDGREVAGRPVVGAVLPVEYARADDEVVELIEDHEPDALLATGLAAGRAAVCVERVGVNVNDCAGVPDNAGAEPRDERIDPSGPAAYFATVPVRETVAALLDADIPARVSNTAGTHLCNNVLYSALAYAGVAELDLAAGFLHLPCTPDQAARKGREGEALAGREVPPSLPLSVGTEAVELALEALAGDG